MTGRNKLGFWSGFYAVDAVLDDVIPPSTPKQPCLTDNPKQPPKYTVRVNDTNPVFYYCSAPDSCTKQGMVGVINPNASTLLQTQRQLALQASYQLSPGEPFPFEAKTPSSSTLPDGRTPQQTMSPSHGGGKLGTGAITGIAIVCVSVVRLGALLAFFWGRPKGLKEEVRRKGRTVVRSTKPRNTWYLTHSPAPQAWPSPQTQLSPPYMENNSPMTSHAVPPAYYESQYGSSSTSPQHVGLEVNVDRISHVSRAASHRSMGGTFEFCPMTGYYTLTHDSPSSNSHLYKYSPPTRTSDMTIPVDPGLIQPSELQRVVR
ncbi:uncharacterized protein N0V89_000970 [Didymosphaeria variabile]|uniref:Phytocyanin domain-containing protein n=1 Tax=Didymosphaeria variabile TaxID=1932322 RepID=A0A9W9CFF7_9PLEO|nr:uncharacterized protein N0V89_000970 [Didymosphaeria variabile]KAJ4360408.1 hypothetical protein N0V89_000970 [Didymosphaeria variabile]